MELEFLLLYSQLIITDLHRESVAPNQHLYNRFIQDPF
jgi:hypothetical protein